ncbi:MAG: hypothetical protein QF531_03010, partial [Candidatus Poseidonia sp.]|nr:hypothetical protein [Poseidonia sp.]
SWYVAVVPYDDAVAKTTVEAIELEAFGSEGAGTTPDGEEGQLSLEALLTGPNLLAAGMLLIVLILLVIVVRSRSSAQRRSKSWELQEATWGIQDGGGWDAPSQAPPNSAPTSTPAPPQGISQQQANDIYAAANQIQTDAYGRTAYEAPQPVLQPQVNTDLLDGLLDGPSEPKKPQIDTSFLDDLL